MDIVGRRWNGLIIQAIGKGCVSFSQIGRFVGGLSDAMLARRLRELEGQALITRSVLDARPPAVRYALTEAGLGLVPVLDALTEWGERYVGGRADAQTETRAS